ncbi:MAG: hypothetical protein RIT81_34835 [Deltaproteobacteria bacterium]
MALGDLTIVGGNAACLVAAHESALAGAHVKLLLPSAGLHPATVTGRRVDTGPRYVAVRKSELLDPVERALARVGASSQHVERFVTQTLEVPLVETQAPQMMFRGHRCPDLFATNDPAALAALLTVEEVACMRDELASRTWRPTGTIEQASLYNHGDTFTRLFVEPRAEKIYPASWRIVDARDRRRLAVPLIDPVVLRAALYGYSPVLPTIPTYYYPECGNFSVIAERLYDLVLRNPSIEVHEFSKIEGLDGSRSSLVTDHGAHTIEGPLVLGLSIDQLSPLARLSDVCDLQRFDVAWFEVERDAVSPAAYVNLMDANHDAFRASFGGRTDDPAKTILCLELAAGGDAEAALEASELVTPGTSVERVGRLSSVARIAPSVRNRRLVDWAKRRLADLDPIYVGLLHDFSDGTMTEHLRQGLRAALMVKSRLEANRTLESDLLPSVPLSAFGAETPMPSFN